MSKVCLNPQHYDFAGAVQFFPCGRCPNCRDLKRLQMASRLLLEKACHPEYDLFFLALTYEDSQLPCRGFDKSHIDSFLGSLRKRLDRSFSDSLRYLLVGEYGDLEKRQHFHLVALTGRKYSYRLPLIELPSGYRCYSNDFVDLVRKCWPYGHVDDGGTPTAAAILYSCGYALKEDEFSLDHEDELRELWHYKHDKEHRFHSIPKRLARLQPYIPLRRFSLKPGLGLDEDTINFVYRYMFNDGKHFRFSFDFGDGMIVPIPGIYLDKFSKYCDPTFGDFCKLVRQNQFLSSQQDALSESFDRCPNDSLSKQVRRERVKKRLDEKIQKSLSQQSNIFRHAIP